ncbi:hypothetical protein [Mycobacterium paraffinicum]|uniref:RES domain-containing protein n=1 Tax=Mycobacterium paraffinicum TaxID=53378 RepID=A0ABP8EZT4_9MYCO|nr:hypothetical protein [Mycobacterium paraffinicum]MCV7311783.1 hypothetical protein [Mycobacterium paraffinicum]
MSATVRTLPVKRRQWSWPGWPAGLYEDCAGYHHYEDGGGNLDRATFDECAAAVGEFNRPALLSDLATDGVLELSRPDMAGAVAGVWSTSEHSETALSRSRWVELFGANGFSVDGQRAERLAEPIRLFRGCVPAFRHVDSDGRIVEVDDHGYPADPYGEVVETQDTRRGMAWTTNMRAAGRFARRGPWGQQCGQVFAATVSPEHLLAVISVDYIVDPAGLADVAPIDLGIAAVNR